MIPVSCWCFILLLLLSKVVAFDVTKQHYRLQQNIDTTATSEHPPVDDKNNKDTFPDSSNQPHSRQKRLIWVTEDGRLALPPGTSLVIAPTLAMPFVRYPPDGFHSNLSISIPLTSESCVHGTRMKITSDGSFLPIHPLSCCAFSHTQSPIVFHIHSRF